MMRKLLRRDTLSNEQLDFFGLERQPFQLSPNPDFLYLSPSHEECLQRIRLTLELRNGLFVGVGDSGTGKTTICNLLLNEFSSDKDMIVGMLHHPWAPSPYAFYHMLCDEIGAPAGGPKSTIARRTALFQFIQNQVLQENKSLVLIVDESQQLTPKQIEIVRGLLNLETAEAKLIQMIIFGQMEFLNSISGKRFKNFRQRVAMSYVLTPLSLADTGAMINFRLKKAGYKGKNIFTKEAVDELYRSSSGLPRAITKFCHVAMLIAFFQQEKVIDKDVAVQAVQSTPLKGVDENE
ncbi:MAG: AAA family ATPase [Chloroflexi bacterium]|nr:AAA family ATPase [Chloroflexota bacterium]